MGKQITTVQQLIARVKSYNPKANIARIKKAYEFAKHAHEGQSRQSGEPFIVHLLGTAANLVDLEPNSRTIAAALLHDVVEDASITIGTIKKEFGEEIANMVEGVTKTKGVKFESKEDYQAENLRKVLFATTKDVRVMIIKLADRLHNMQTLKHMREDKRKRIAQETLDIFTPIAEKLGMWKIKGELEDLALLHLQPQVYKSLKKKIVSRRDVRERRTQQFIEELRAKIKEENIVAVVKGRAKYFYSIYQKMREEKKTFSQIYDLIALRIIVKTIPECYHVLDVVEKLWKPVKGRIKDFIKNPKPNHYQSIHTTVTSGKHMIEVQVRTLLMDYEAEYGVAAHWKYKGTDRDKKFDKRITWLKQILEWKKSSRSAMDFIEGVKIDLFQNEIVVFSPRGEPITLPVDASPVDFAYDIHTNIGNECSKAMVNGKIVPMDHILKPGDVVEIITQKNAMPSRSWLNFVKTRLARSKIRSRLGIKPDSRTPKQRRIEVEVEPYDYIVVHGKHQVKLSRCCKPQVGDEILGFMTKDRKVTVHKKECINARGIEENRIVPVYWKHTEEADKVNLLVTSKDKVGILRVILTVMNKAGIILEEINTRAIKDNINILFTIKLNKNEQEILDDLMTRIRRISYILNVRKLE